MPIATRSASAKPVAVAPPESRLARAVIPRKLSATPSSTRPLPPSPAGSAAWSANDSLSASTPRNARSPAVKAMNAESQAALACRSAGSHRSPSATGRIPTSVPISA